MGESAWDARYSAGALRAAIGAVLRDGNLRAAALSGLCIVSLAPAASALTLGELEIRSRLGEPLEASVPLTLGPGETLAAGCISQGPGGDGLARLPQLRIQAPVAGQAGTYTVRLTTPRPLHEPMYGIDLRVACPGTPVMVRQYVLMLDLPGTVLAAAPAAPPARPVAAPAATPTAAATPISGPQPAGQRPAIRAPRGPISQGSRYQVAAGDTLSLIAQRVADRNGVGIWEMAALIQQANPSAFINGNPDLIRLGSELAIPALGAGAFAGTEQPTATPSVVPPPMPVELPAAISPPAPASATVTAPQPAAVAGAADLAPVVTPSSAPALDIEVLPALPAPSAALAAVQPTPAGAADEPPTALAPAPAPARRGANPLLATAVGIGFGLLISLLFGRISLAGLRRGQANAGRQERPAAPVRPGRPEEESGITVIESPAQEPVALAPLAAARSAAAPMAAVAGAAVTGAAGGEAASRPTAAASMEPHAGPETAPALTDTSRSRLQGVDWRDLDDDITDELSALFGAEDLSLPDHPAADATADVPALSGDTVLAEAAAPFEETDLDAIDPSATAAISGLEWEALDSSIDDEVEDTPGIAPARVVSTGIDLPALTASATQDEQLSESLVEALKMLEQDYQQEMTATQLAPMAEHGTAEPTITEEMPAFVKVQPVTEAESADPTAEQPRPLKRQGLG